MAWIRWRKNARGESAATVEYRNGEGTIKTIPLGPVSPVEAETKRAWCERVVEKREAKKEPVGWPTALNRFKESIQLRDGSAQTVDFYDARLRPMFEAFSGPMGEWHPGMLLDWLALHPDWSPRTKQATINAAKSFIRWAHIARLHVGDFHGGIRGPRVERKERAHFTPGEVSALLDGLKGAGWLEVGAALCALAGASLSDLYRLTWGEVDTTGPVWWIRSKRAKTGEEWVAPIPARLRGVLEVYRATTGLVCRGIPADDSSATKALRAAYRRVGLEDTGGFKRLRHSYGAALGVGRDVDLPTARKMLGHSPGSASTLIYLHTDSARQEEAARVINRAVGG